MATFDEVAGVSFDDDPGIFDQIDVGCSAATVVAAGQSASIEERTVVSATAAVVSVSGATASLSQYLIIPGTAATVVATGGTGAVYSSTTVPANVGTVVVAGQTATVLSRTLIAATPATVVVIGGSGALSETIPIVCSAAVVVVSANTAGIQDLWYRYSRPVADDTDGNWQPSAGTDLYDCIDEAVAADADYIYTNTTASKCKVKLAGVIDPGTSTGHVLTVRASSQADNSVVVRLVQGSTTVAETTHVALTSSFENYTLTLSGVEADSITDYTDLYVELEAA